MKQSMKKWNSGISVLIVFLVVVLVLFLNSYGTLSISGSDDDQIKLCEDSTCFYRQSSDECVCNLIENLDCAEPYMLEQPATQISCSTIGGFWDECPQCPKGRVCSQSICEASCSKGQVCTYDNPLKKECFDEDDVDRTGICFDMGDKVEPLYQDENSISCPSGSESVKGLSACRIVLREIDLCVEEDSTYNQRTGLCELPYNSSDVCKDGSEFSFDLVTLNNKCYNTNFQEITDVNLQLFPGVTSINALEEFSREPVFNSMLVLILVLLSIAFAVLVGFNLKQ